MIKSKIIGQPSLEGWDSWSPNQPLLEHVTKLVTMCGHIVACGVTFLLAK
jgi:hypothetical protein